MASLTMTSSFIAGARLPTRTNNRYQVAPKATIRAQLEASSPKHDTREETNNRRTLILSAVVAAAAGVSQMAMAKEEPKPGSPEAKKIYAPICVTMPTAKICRR